MSIDYQCQLTPATREIGDWQELANCRNEWWRLWRKCPTATPFQSPAWLLGWWRHFGHGRLRVVTWEAAGKWVGLAPFFIYPNPPAGQRTLALIGTGISDYLDILTAPGWESACARHLRQWLTEHAEEWDVADWQELRPGSALLSPDIATSCDARVKAQSVCPVLDLPPAEEPWPVPQPARLLGDANYYQRKAERTGTVEIVSARKDNLPELFENLLTLHESRWQARNETGVLAHAAVRKFHWEVAEEFLREGVLRLYGLRLAGTWAASFYGWHHRHRLYYYLGGLEPQRGQLSPGTMMIAHALRAARAEGARRFDFLRGPEPYKYRWGARDEATYRCRWFSRSDRELRQSEILLT